MKNRIVAFLIAIVAVLGASTLSAYNGLNKDIKKVEMLYFDGVRADGYKHPSIDSQMKVKYQSINNVVSVLRDYPELEDVTEELRDAQDAVYSYFNDYQDYTVEGMSWANRTLEDTLDKMEQKIADVDFTDSERKILDTCLGDLEGAQSMIEQSGYNEAVREFNSTKMSRFPAKQLLALFDRHSRGASYFEY